MKKLRSILFIMTFFNHVVAADHNILKQTGSKLDLITQWAKSKTANARRLFFCLGNPSKCDPKEVKTARTWLVGVPVTIVIATAAAIGLKLWKDNVETMKAQSAEQLEVDAEEQSQKEESEMTKLAEKPLYKAIDKAYSIVNAVAGKLNSDSQSVYREIENYEQFVSKITQQEFELFRNALHSEITRINALSQQELGTDRIDLQLTEECNNGDSPEYRQFICDMKNKFLAIKRLDDEFQSVGTILESLYKTKK